MNSEKEKKRILELAEKYVKKGKIEEAIAEYRKLLAENAQDLNLISVIGDLYLKSGQKEKAIEEFKKVAEFYEKRGLYNQSLAIYKKINRLDPDDMEISTKLADLYSNQGFFSEARAGYLSIARNLKDNGRSKKAISIYEKILKLNKRDYETKLILAHLYSKERLVEKAVEEFNEVAEFLIKNEDLKRAKELLSQAKTLKKDDLRTLANLIEIFRKEDKKEQALKLINDVLKRDVNNLRALSLMGNLFFEEKRFKKAKNVFRKIISLNPKDVEARVKLGRIYIREGKLDEAFENYEPLVDSLLRKQKEEKAIGLLGLILAAKKAHLPTLDKIASIYKSNNQIRNLEIAYRAILEECRRKNLKKKSFAILKEIINLSPLDEKSSAEYRKLKRELGISEEKKIPGELPISADVAKKIIEENLAKADLYTDQGLINNAKRILEDLRIKFPDELLIQQKLTALSQISAKVKEEEIPRRVEEVTAEETKLFGKDLLKEERKTRSSLSEGGGEEKLTAADIFAETDIMPAAPHEGRGKKYYDLSEKIDEELEAIRSIFQKQLKGDTTVVEKELSEIISEFRKGVEERISREDYESHFNLGIAYLEQGLIDEAIQEFELASQDEKKTIDCYSVLSVCFRRKNDFKQAVKWLEKALDLSETGSSQFFGLKYELAAVYEEIKEWKKALKLYNEIKKGSPEYLDVARRVEKLKKKSQK